VREPEEVVANEKWSHTRWKALEERIEKYAERKQYNDPTNKHIVLNGSSRGPNAPYILNDFIYQLRDTSIKTSQVSHRKELVKVETLVHVAIQNIEGGIRVGKLRMSTLPSLKQIQKQSSNLNIKKWRKKRKGVPLKYPDDDSWAAMLEYLIEEMEKWVSHSKDYTKS